MLGYGNSIYNGYYCIIIGWSISYLNGITWAFLSYSDSPCFSSTIQSNNPLTSLSYCIVWSLFMKLANVMTPLVVLNSMAASTKYALTFLTCWISEAGITNTVVPNNVLGLKYEWKHILFVNMYILPCNSILLSNAHA